MKRIEKGDIRMKILLVEPNYRNKYPSMGLMKISTYHKNHGDEVTFFKGIMVTLTKEKLRGDLVYCL